MFVHQRIYHPLRPNYPFIVRPQRTVKILGTFLVPRRNAVPFVDRGHDVDAGEEDAGAHPGAAARQPLA